MSYNQKQIKTDVNDKPVPQYFNKDLQDFEVLEGQSGASKVITYDSSGNESNVNVAVQPILDKLTQLTGTVIDEEIRKDNEQDRVQLYNDLLVELDRIAQITEQVPQSVLDSVSNLSDKIGQLQELDTAEKTNIVLALNEIYQDLVAHKAENMSQVGGVHGLEIEEGTFTPYLNSGQYTYAEQTGDYKRIGNYVYITGRVVISSIEEIGDYYLDLLGLPFTAQLGNDYALSLSRYGAINIGENYIDINASINGMYVRFYKHNASGSLTNILKTDLTNNSRISFSGGYLIN